MKKLKRKSWGNIYGGLNNSDIFLGISMAMFMCRAVIMPRAMCMLRNTWEGSQLSHLADLEPLYKQGVRAKVKMSTTCLSVEDMPPTYTEPLSKDWEIYWFQVATYTSINKWMDKEGVVHIYNGILLSHKKEWNGVSYSDVDEPRACHTQWSMSEREKQMSYINAYIWNLENWYWWAYLEGNNRDTDIENELVDTLG